MRALKGFQKLAMVSAIAVMAASGASVANADNVATLGHIFASVTGLLSVTEIAPIKFGNFAAGTCLAGTDAIKLAPDGTRSIVGGTCFSLLNGANSTASGSGVTALNGVGQPAGAATETGAQAPGFIQISDGDSGFVGGTTVVYVTFANSTGQIIDTFQHNNSTPLTGPTPNAFTVNGFTIQGNTGTTGYASNASVGTTVQYGTPVTLPASPSTFRVGATLTAAAATIAPGQYSGTYYVMVSY